MWLSFLLITLQGVFISKIAEGGTAERDGRLQVGDKVLSVSSTDIIQFIVGFQGYDKSGAITCSYITRKMYCFVLFLR